MWWKLPNRSNLRFFTESALSPICIGVRMSMVDVKTFRSVFLKYCRNANFIFVLRTAISSLICTCFLRFLRRPLLYKRHWCRKTSHRMTSEVQGYSFKWKSPDTKYFNIWQVGMKNDIDRVSKIIQDHSGHYNWEKYLKKKGFATKQSPSERRIW